LRSVRIGLLVPLSGSAGLWAPSAEACGRLAVSELNQAAGIMRRPVELIVVNAGETGRSAAHAAREAVDELAVDGLIGMLPSYARDPVVQATQGQVPFVYTPQFEGLATNADVMTTGETAGELMAPAIRWLSEAKRARRFFLCGNDYIWPRASLQIAKRLIAGVGCTVTGECYLPVGAHDFDEMLDRIKITRSDVVLPVFLGFDCIAFSRAFCAAGLSRHVLRFSSAFDETIVYGLDSSQTENLFVASSYFASMHSRNNGAFLERYYTAYGDNPPPPNGYGESCYEGVHALAALIERAGSFDARELRRYYGRTLQRRTARGVEAQPVVGGRHPVHLAELDGYDFSLVATSH
jgi:urea transport system substrate-binding protein